MINQLLKESVDVFEDSLAFAVLSGTVAYQTLESSSDVDLMIILKNQVADEKLYSQRLEFTKKYMRLHKNLHYTPDVIYPGEVISLDMLEDAISGRGYYTDGETRLKKILTNDEWTQEDEYRCWRSMALFHNEMFLSGDRQLFDSYTARAHNIITLQVISDMDIERFADVNELKDMVSSYVIKQGKGYLGISERYEPEFSRHYPSTEHMMKNEFMWNYLHICEDGVFVSLDKINEMFLKIKNKNITKTFKSKQLFDWRIIHENYNTWNRRP